MNEPFELEWQGGPAEHHFRKARPGVEDLPWGSLPLRDFPPALVEAARKSWTEVVLGEYRAIVCFTDVTKALALAKAPLDLLGMACDFLADECLHVELASRLAMDLGGGVPRHVDLDQFSILPSARLTPRQRANELVLTVSCIGEAFTAGTSLGSQRVASHPLPKAVHDIILADEARHRHLGKLYFEWVGNDLDDAERSRLACVAERALEAIAPYWRRRVSPVVDGKTEEGFRVDDIHALGWLESRSLVPLCKEVAERDIVGTLDDLGIVISQSARHRLFGDPEPAGTALVSAQS